MRKQIFGLILVLASFAASAYSIPGKMMRFVGTDYDGTALCVSQMGTIMLNNAPKVVLDSLEHYADGDMYQLIFHVDIDVSTPLGKSLAKAIAEDPALEIVHLGYKDSENKISVFAPASEDTSKKAKPGHKKMTILVNFTMMGGGDDSNFRDFWRYPIKSLVWNKSGKTMTIPKVDGEAIRDAIAKMMIANAEDYKGISNDWSLYPKNKEMLNIYLKDYRWPFEFVNQAEITFPPSSDKDIFQEGYKNITLRQLLTKPFGCCTFNMTAAQMEATLKKYGFKYDVYDCEYFKTITVWDKCSSQGYEISYFTYKFYKDRKYKQYTISLKNPDWQDGNNVIDERAATLKIVAHLREMGIKMYPGDKTLFDDYGQRNLDRGWYIGAMGQNRICVGFHQFTYATSVNDPEIKVGCEMEITVEIP